MDNLLNQSTIKILATQNNDIQLLIVNHYL